MLFRSAELKDKVENNQSFDVHVGFEITLEHVVHVQDLLNKILENYLEVFGRLPINRKINTINQKLREENSPSTVDLAQFTNVQRGTIFMWFVTVLVICIITGVRLFSNQLDPDGTNYEDKP